MEKVMQNKRIIKIICVALAVLLWIYVSYQENPSMSKTVKNVPIFLVGEQALKEKGFSVYSVSEQSVSVKATANRSTLSRVNNRTLTANINVSSLKKAGSYVLPVTIASSVSSTANYYVKESDITVIIEPIMKDTFNIEPFIGELPDETKFLESYTLSAEKVNVSAPKSIISDIGNVRTEPINISSQSETLTVRPVAYAKNGKSLEGVEFSPSEITVSYIVSDIKKVSVVLKTTEGKEYALPSQYDVALYGTGENFSNLKQVETLPVNLSGVKDGDTITATLDIPAYSKSKSETAEIQIKIESALFDNDK